MLILQGYLDPVQAALLISFLLVWVFGLVTLLHLVAHGSAKKGTEQEFVIFDEPDGRYNVGLVVRKDNFGVDCTVLGGSHYYRENCGDTYFNLSYLRIIAFTNDYRFPKQREDYEQSRSSEEEK